MVTIVVAIVNHLNFLVFVIRVLRQPTNHFRFTKHCGQTTCPLWNIQKVCGLCQGLICNSKLHTYLMGDSGKAMLIIL